jgi:hypothetical protein
MVSFRTETKIGQCVVNAGQQHHTAQQPRRCVHSAVVFDELLDLHHPPVDGLNGAARLRRDQRHDGQASVSHRSAGRLQRSNQLDTDSRPVHPTTTPKSGRRTVVL